MNSLLPKEETVIVSSLVSGLFTSPLTRTLFSICLLMLLSFQSYGQETIWVSAAKEDGIELFISYNQCEQVTIKVVNTTDQAVTVQWKEKVVDHSSGTEYPLHNGSTKTLKIEANAELVGQCENGLSQLITDTSSVIESIGDGVSNLMIENLSVSNN